MKLCGTYPVVRQVVLCNPPVPMRIMVGRKGNPPCGFRGKAASARDRTSTLDSHPAPLHRSRPPRLPGAAAL